MWISRAVYIEKFFFPAFWQGWITGYKNTLYSLEFEIIDGAPPSSFSLTLNILPLEDHILGTFLAVCGKDCKFPLQGLGLIPDWELRFCMLCGVAQKKGNALV